jgi:NADH-quinone oxidoreductase subunit L
MDQILLSLILIPAVIGLILLAVPSRMKYLQAVLAILTAGGLFFLPLLLWGKQIDLRLPWVGFGIDFQLRWYAFSQFMVLAIAGFSLLISIYSQKYMTGRSTNNQFYGFLFIAEAMAMGAVLANNLVLLIFFWEGLLIVLYALIALGHERSYRTGMKTFIIVGFTDLCLMFGVMLIGVQAGTFVMTDVHLTTTGLNGVAFLLLLIGALGKAGAMPFHSWIPDAAVDAPLPFVALIPSAVEKLLGIYLVTRIVLDFFTPDPMMRLVVMLIGAVTIICADMMALVQNDYKRLLAYSAIGQVGYMVLGIGTGVPAGVVGGLFHLINHAMYKSALFLTAGAVEQQTGTSDLRKLGGLGRKMPWTFVCFIVTAASLSGIPLFSGFVSKELIFEGTLEAGYPIFFLAAVAGAFITLAATLKLGHAVFLGHSTAHTEKAKEASGTLLLPATILAIGCVLFGIYQAWPLNTLVKPSLIATGLGEHASEVHFAFNLGWLFWVTVAVTVLGVLNHWLGVKLTGRAVAVSNHIRRLPGLATIYRLAEERYFDPYDQSKKAFQPLALTLFRIDRGVDWVFQSFAPAVAARVSSLRRIHNGLYSNYLAWSVGGLILIVFYITWFIR